MKCKRCIERGKTWQGDEPRCAFSEGVFSEDNWNCATMNDLRGKCELRHWNDDQYSAIVPVPAHGDDSGQFIVLGWYKNRGTTEFASVMSASLLLSLTPEIAERACNGR